MYFLRLNIIVLFGYQTWDDKDICR